GLDEQIRVLLTMLGVRSCLFVGLYLHDEPAGFVVAAQRGKRRSFSAEEIEFSQALAHQAIVAVENARLYERTDEALGRRLHELAAIEEIDHQLGTRLDYDRIIDLVLERAVEAGGAVSGLIGILVSDGRRLETRSLRAGQGQAPVWTSGEWPIADSPVPPAIIDRVVRSGQPLLIDDVGQEPDEGRTAGQGAVLAVPITRDERVIGLLTLESQQVAAFGPQDLRFVEHLAEHAGIAIENARLFREEQRRAADLATLNQVSALVTSELDPDRVLETIVDSVIDVAGCEKAAIFALEGGHISLRTSRGLSEAYVAGAQNIEVTPTSRAQAVFSGEPLVVPDILADPRLADFVELARGEGFRAVADVPLHGRSANLGELTVYYAEPHFFTTVELDTLKTFANQAAIALENARLFQQEHERVQVLSAIGDIGREVRAGLDLDRTLNLILARIRDLVDYYLAEICLWDEQRQVLITHATAGDPRYTARAGGIYYPDEGFSGWIARHQEVLLLPDISARSDVRPKVEDDESPIRSYVGLPLRTGDTFIGTLELAGDRLYTYDETAVEILSIIADQAAVAIQGARLFDTQQHQVRELGILFETGAAISSSLALDEVLRTVALQMARALEVSSCSISDWDEEQGLVTTLAAEAAHPGQAAQAMTGDVGQSYAAVDYPTTAQALQQRLPQVVQVDDPQGDPAEQALLEEFGQKSLLMIPMVARDHVVGLVELYEHRQARKFTADDVRLGSALANQAAIAIENARLYERTDERLQARVDELTAVQRITAELNATLELDHILSVVLETAVATTRASHGNVMLVDMSRDNWLADPRLQVRVAQGYSEEERAAIDKMLLAEEAAEEQEGSLVLQVARSGQARIVQDAWAESYRVGVKDATRSALIVPIFYEGLVVGLINLRRTQPAAFDQQDLSFVQALGQQAAVALGNALRFEEQVRANTNLRERTQQMTSLLQVSRKLRTDVPLEETLEEIAYAIQETVGFNLVLISIVEGAWAVEGRGASAGASAAREGTRLTRRVAAAGLSLRQFEELASVRQPASRYEALFSPQYEFGPAYFFPWQKRAEWEPGIHTMTTMPQVEDWQEGRWHPQDMLLVPLRGSGGRILGHISVDEPRDGLRPSRRDIDALAIFANQATIAVENANLYEDAQRRAENLALINEVGRTLTQVLDPEMVLTTVVRAVVDLLGCELSAVFQVDRMDGRLAAVASRGVDLADMADLRFSPGEGLVGRVAETHSPLLILDTSQEPLFVEGPTPVGSMLLAPIMAGRQLMGVITAGCASPYGLSEVDQVLMTTLADQAAVALESARLFASTQQAAVRLSLLNEIGRRAAAQLEFREMLKTTVDALHRNLEYFRVAVLLVNEAGTELTVAAANEGFWPVIPPDFRQRVGEGLIGQAAASGEPVLVHDTSADDRYFPVDEWQCLSSLSVPIKLGLEGQRLEVIGVLHAEAERCMAFTEEDVAALSIAADQLAVAIENARLFQETQRRVAELATINEIGRAISGALDASELYELIYHHVSKLLDTRNFHIALYDPDEECIRVEFLVEHGQVQPPVVLQMGQGLTSHLIRNGEPILLSQGSDDFLEAHGLSLERDPARSWLGVPMIAEDRVIGAIAVQSFEHDYAFDSGHLELLRTIAGQAAIAFQNARLFEERDRRIDELAVLNEMAQALGSTLEM
ncbi:MAG: GAF domain-containing protein, partial [Anaerolineae bacterium]